MKKMIIIGAGIAGLSAGIYARKNGYDVTIYESHFLPGGMCTSWKRQNFTFEGCLHYVMLVGINPEHSLYNLWKDLGVVPGLKMQQHEVFHTFRDKSGRTLNLYMDANKLEKELLRLSPVDEIEIKTLCNAIKKFSWFVRAPSWNPLRFVVKFYNILTAIPLLKKYGNMNLIQYSARFKDPLIQSALSTIFVSPDFAFTQLCFFWASLHIKSSGYPEGSSLMLARSIERTFLNLNGKIKYKKKVKRIAVDGGIAKSIELENGEIDSADIIISAADAHATLSTLLEDKYWTPTLRDRFATQPLYSSFIQVSLGVNRDMTESPHAMKIEMANPFELAGQTYQEMWYQHFSYDPTLAPPGKTVLTVLFPTDFTWWQKIPYQSEAYRVEKKKILVITIAQLELILPGISSQIEVSDVSTPYTTFRYTNNWKGAIGFVMSEKITAEMTMKPQYTLPGLDHFYMIGQWVKGFGLPMAANTGKEVIQNICKNDRKKF